MRALVVTNPFGGHAKGALIVDDIEAVRAAQGLSVIAIEIDSEEPEPEPAVETVAEASFGAAVEASEAAPELESDHAPADAEPHVEV